MTHITFKPMALFAITAVLFTGCSAKTPTPETPWTATPNPVVSVAPVAPPAAPPPPVEAPAAPAPPVVEAPPAPVPPPPPPPAAPVQPAADPKFKSCTEVKKNKLGPYHKGQTEYEWYQDKDKDGVVCE